MPYPADISIAGVDWTATIVKTTPEGVTSSTTLQDDNELKFSILANKPYYFHLLLVYDEVAGSGTPDIKHAFGLSAGTFSRGWRSHSGLGPTTAAANDAITGDMTTAIPNATVAEVLIAQMHGFFIASADAIMSFQWAQNTSSANEVRVREGSYLKYYRPF